MLPIKCPNCGEKVSVLHEECPFCGYSFKNDDGEHHFDEDLNDEEYIEEILEDD